MAMAKTFAAVLAVLCGALAGGPAGADDVLLKNGRAFEGVIAEVAGERVRIRIPGGELSLPLAQVLRIDAAESAYAGYVARRRELRGRAGAGAEDWLALARWALAHDLGQCAREAALVAAALDPRLAGLEALLHGFGYRLDAELGRFIPHEEWMTRRGFVSYQGEWITRGEQEARLLRVRQEMAERAAHLAAEREAAWRRAEIAELRHRPRRETYLVVPAFSYPVAFFPGFFFPQPIPPAPPAGEPEDGTAPPPQQRIDSFLLRQPGSLLPGNLDLVPRPLRASRSGD